MELASKIYLTIMAVLLIMTIIGCIIKCLADGYYPKIIDVMIFSFPIAIFISIILFICLFIYNIWEV